MKKKLMAIMVGCTLTAGAHAATFVNGGFEDGNTNGWTTGGGFRGADLNPSMAPSRFLPGGDRFDASINHSAIISAGTVDPQVGAALGTTVFAGNSSFRAEDTTSGGYASAISQKVLGYTDPNIFFAWKAVLQNGGHTQDQSALLMITLHDDTSNTNLITRVYNAGAGGGGVDARFSTDPGTGAFYTPQWQIEQLAIDQSLSGHDFTLSLLAADCEPTGHFGYAYLDGFGGVIPQQGTPEPTSLALLGLGVVGLGWARRKTK